MIKVENLTKAFGPKVAVNDISAKGIEETLGMIAAAGGDTRQNAVDSLEVAPSALACLGAIVRPGGSVASMSLVWTLKYGLWS